jgi:hypothetical protein
MIELTEQQQQALNQESPPRVLNPRTQERFVLIPEDVYESVRKIVAPLNRNWDNPADDDLIRKKA